MNSLHLNSRRLMADAPWALEDHLASASPHLGEQS
jgi:hypothetical protein